MAQVVSEARALLVVQEVPEKLLPESRQRKPAVSGLIGGKGGDRAPPDMVKEQSTDKRPASEAELTATQLQRTS